MKNPAACLRQLFFPHFHISEVEPVALQQQLCACFAEWGLPQSIKVDNGKPFGDPQRTSVPELALWLIALGVQMIWNRPRSPRDNAKVERMQGTTSRWAQIQSCSSCSQLQTRLDEVAQLQRERYQVKRLGHQSRRQCYPQLWSNSTRYSSQSFEVSRVECYLSQVAFVRKVTSRGLFSFYAQTVYIGYTHRGKTISLHYDAAGKQFMIAEPDGNIVACLAAGNFSSQNIEGLNVCQSHYVKCSNFMSG